MYVCIYLYMCVYTYTVYTYIQCMIHKYGQPKIYVYICIYIDIYVYTQPDKTLACIFFPCLPHKTRHCIADGHTQVWRQAQHFASVSPSDGSTLCTARISQLLPFTPASTAAPSRRDSDRETISHFPPHRLLPRTPVEQDLSGPPPACSASLGLSVG